MTVASTAFALSLGSVNAADVSSEKISGTWSGIYYAFPNIMEFEMSIEEGNGSAKEILTGKLNYSASQVGQQTARNPDSVEYAFAGEYDPEFQYFQIKANKWLKPPPANHRISPPPILGVYDPTSDTLGGILDVPEIGSESDHFFFCVRSSKKDELHEFVRLITGVAAKEAELESKRQRQADEVNYRREQLAISQTLSSYKPQINAAESKVASQERAVNRTKRSIASREWGRTLPTAPPASFRSARSTMPENFSLRINLNSPRPDGAHPQSSKEFRNARRSRLRRRRLTQLRAALLATGWVIRPLMQAVNCTRACAGPATAPAGGDNREVRITNHTEFARMHPSSFNVRPIFLTGTIWVELAPADLPMELDLAPADLAGGMEFFGSGADHRREESPNQNS